MHVKERALLYLRHWFEIEEKAPKIFRCINKFVLSVES